MESKGKCRPPHSSVADGNPVADVEVIQERGAAVVGPVRGGHGGLAGGHPRHRGDRDGEPYKVAFALYFNLQTRSNSLLRGQGHGGEDEEALAVHGDDGSASSEVGVTYVFSAIPVRCSSSERSRIIYSDCP